MEALHKRDTNHSVSSY